MLYRAVSARSSLPNVSVLFNARPNTRGVPRRRSVRSGKQYVCSPA